MSFMHVNVTDIVNFDMLDKASPVFYIEENIIDGTILPTPEILAVKCSDLLKIFENYPGCDLSYKIEIIPFAGSCKLRLCLDSRIWYDKLLKEKSQQEKVKIGREYVNRLRTELIEKSPVYPENLPINTNPYCDFPLTCFFVKEKDKKGICYHFTQGKCNYGDGCNKLHGDSRAPCKNGNHAKVYCKEINTVRKNGISLPCNWYCRDELVLENFLDDPNYVVTTRPTPTRDILVCPIEHISNSSLIKSESFWKIILITVDKLKELTQCECPIEMITVNFGLWETQQSEDRYAIDCHGHFHLHITEKAMKILQTIEKYEAPLRGRNHHPEDYREKDTKELESSRLIGDEMTVLSSRLDRIEQVAARTEQDIGNIKILLEKLLLGFAMLQNNK